MTGLRGEPLSVAVDRVAGGDVVSVIGEVDIYTYVTFRGLMYGDDRAWQRLLVLDLGGVTFMDSMGVSALAAARRSVLARGAVMVLAAVPGPVARLLRIVRLDELLPVYDSVDEALAHPPHS